MRNRLIIFAVMCFVRCGTAGIYDEALTDYSRIVRAGLNEWYPLNGNLSSRIGGAGGTATAGYVTGMNRANENGKTICTTASRFDFGSANFGANPFTISAWIKLNTVPGSLNSILQKGTTSTFWIGFKIEQNGATALPLTFGNGAGGVNLTSSGVAAGTWYYFAFSYGNGTGTYYVGTYGSNLAVAGSSAGNYTQSGTLQIFTSVLDACADDLLHYNRVLSFDELNQNFKSLE